MTSERGSSGWRVSGGSGVGASGWRSGRAGVRRRPSVVASARERRSSVREWRRPRGQWGSRVPGGPADRAWGVSGWRSGRSEGSSSSEGGRRRPGIGVGRLPEVRRIGCRGRSSWAFGTGGVRRRAGDRWRRSGDRRWSGAVVGLPVGGGDRRVGECPADRASERRDGVRDGPGVRRRPKIGGVGPGAGIVGERLASSAGAVA